MIEEEENSHLDESLRHVFSDFHLEPTAPVWAGIEQRIGRGPEPPKPKRRPIPLPLLLPLAFLLGVAGGWLLPRSGPAGRTAELARVPRPAASAAPARTQTASQPRQQLRARQPAPLASRRPALVAAGASAAGVAPASFVRPASAAPTIRPTAAPSNWPAASPTTPTFFPTISLPDSGRTNRSETAAASIFVVGSDTDSVPGVVRPLVGLTRVSLAHLRDSAAPTESRQVALVRSLRAEKSELLRLQRRVDSLLLTLGAVPLANPQAATAAQPGPPPAPDTTRARPLRRWSLLLTATPEQNHQQLQTASTDTLQQLRRNQERGRRGVNAAIMAEYRLDRRLSVGFGLGYQRTGTELRVAERRTDVSVRYDTTVTTATNVYTSTHQTYSIRLEQIPQLNPVFNQSGQVIRYDTVFITRPDTVFTTIVQNDTVHTTNRTVTPLLDRRTSTTYKHLTPTYHFFTVPVLLRYRLTLADNTRWWADVAAGAQVQVFLGGSQLVTEDGRTFRTERVRMAEGPFRPLNLALSGSIGVNYALTPRLSMSLAPSLRWQALSVYRPSTGLVQRSTATGLQIGARWQF